MSEGVLKELFLNIDIIKPLTKLLERAIRRMEAAKKPYRSTFTVFVQDFEPVAGVAYNAIWFQWVAMYLGDTEFI